MKKFHYLVPSMTLLFLGDLKFLIARYNTHLVNHRMGVFPGIFTKRILVYWPIWQPAATLEKSTHCIHYSIYIGGSNPHGRVILSAGYICNKLLTIDDSSWIIHGRLVTFWSLQVVIFCHKFSVGLCTCFALERGE